MRATHDLQWPTSFEGRSHRAASLVGGRFAGTHHCAHALGRAKLTWTHGNTGRQFHLDPQQCFRRHGPCDLLACVEVAKDFLTRGLV